MVAPRVGFHVVCALALDIVSGADDHPVGSFAVRALWTLRDVMLIGGVASLFGAYRSGLARATLIAFISLTVLEQLTPMVTRLGDIDPRTFAKVVRIGLGTVSLFALSSLVWLVARVTVGIGPKVVAGVALALVLTNRLVRWFGERRALSDGVELAMHLTPIVLFIVVLAWRFATVRPAERARAEPGEPWRDAVAGMRLARTAIVGQLVLTLGLLLVAFLVRGSRVSATVLVIVGAVAALAFACMTVVGLGRLRTIPAAADAQGPFSAAWGLAVTGVALVLGVATLFALGVAIEALALRDYAALMRPVQVTAGFVGLGMSVALYNGARRVGRALGAPGLVTQATITIIVGVVLQLAGQLLQDEAIMRALFERAKSMTIAVVATTVIGGVVSIVMTLMTLGALQRTLARRQDTMTWDG